jgi:hypothetical protein
VDGADDAAAFANKRPGASGRDDDFMEGGDAGPISVDCAGAAKASHPYRANACDDTRVASRPFGVAASRSRRRPKSTTRERCAVDCTSYVSARANKRRAASGRGDDFMDVGRAGPINVDCAGAAETGHPYRTDACDDTRVAGRAFGIECSRSTGLAY